MTSKERMLIAIQNGKPDRLPVTVHQWQPYHLKRYMNDMSDIQANRYCGLDASINYYEISGQAGRHWKVSSHITQEKGYYATHYMIETPGGILTASEGTNAMTTWTMEHLIKNREDILLLKKYRPIPCFNREGTLRAYDELGDGGILRTFVWGKQAGCWQDACEMFGVENLILAAFDDPEWVHEFLEILLEQKLAYIDINLRKLPFDLIETGGGASSNTVISPSMHEEFCLPYDRKIHGALHDLGFKVVYHTCGGMTRILDFITDNFCDVSETLSPAAIGGDIEGDESEKLVYNRLHGKVGLIGGMDQFNILEKGTQKQIRNEVERLFNIFGKEGGYILSACDHFFEAPPLNLKIFAEAAGNLLY